MENETNTIDLNTVRTVSTIWTLLAGLATGYLHSSLYPDLAELFKGMNFTLPLSTQLMITGWPFFLYPILMVVAILVALKASPGRAIAVHALCVLAMFGTMTLSVSSVMAPIMQLVQVLQ